MYVSMLQRVEYAKSLAEVAVETVTYHRQPVVGLCLGLRFQPWFFFVYVSVYVSIYDSNDTHVYTAIE